MLVISSNISIHHIQTEPVLEAEFDKKGKQFRRAVKRIEVRVHPRIRTVASLICEAEGVAFSHGNSEPESGDLPDVEPYLRHPAYLEQVQKHYGKLLA